MAPQPLRDIIVDQKQSVELVKVLVSTAISYVAWIRKVFPRDCYERFYYDPTSSSCSTYKSFMEGKGRRVGLDEKGLDVEHLNWRILRRGRNEAVDKLLDWIELGAHDAFEKQYLNTIQFSFYEQQVLPENIIECYTFTFSYSNGRGKEPSVQIGSAFKPGLEVAGVAGSLKDAQRQLDNLIFDVRDSARARADLPVRKFVSMHLTYNKSAPTDYEPPGFRASRVTHIVPAFWKVWTGSMDTGLHNVNVETFSNSQQRCSPSAESSGTTITEGGITQDSAMRLLKSMGRSRRVHGETQDTQPLTNTSQKRIKWTDSMRRQTDIRETPRPYSQVVPNSIARAEQAELDPVPLSDQLDAKALVQQGPLACECGVATQEAMMAICRVCQRSYHIRCYGYLNTTELPVETLCYTCMLAHDPHLLAEIREVCLHRRVLHFISQHGVPKSFKELAQYLNSDIARAKNIISELKAIGNPAMKTLCAQQGKSKSKPQATQYNLVKDAAKLRAVYFRPEYKIAHCCATQQETPSVEFAESSAVMLPKSNTPLRRVLDAASSTQGTPTPEHFAASVRSPLLSMGYARRNVLPNSVDSPGPSKKRTYAEISDTPLSQPLAKRLQESYANSPLAFGP